MVWKLYVNSSASNLRWIRVKAGNHRSSAYLICHFQECLVFTFQHEHICYPTKRQTQLYDFRLAWIIWYIPDVYYSRRFSYGTDFNILSLDNYDKHVAFSLIIHLALFLFGISDFSFCHHLRVSYGSLVSFLYHCLYLSLWFCFRFEIFELNSVCGSGFGVFHASNGFCWKYHLFMMAVDQFISIRKIPKYVRVHPALYTLNKEKYRRSSIQFGNCMSQLWDAWGSRWTTLFCIGTWPKPFFFSCVCVCEYAHFSRFVLVWFGFCFWFCDTKRKWATKREAGREREREWRSQYAYCIDLYFLKVENISSSFLMLSCLNAKITAPFASYSGIFCFSWLYSTVFLDPSIGKLISKRFLKYLNWRNFLRRYFVRIYINFSKSFSMVIENWLLKGSNILLRDRKRGEWEK